MSSKKIVLNKRRSLRKKRTSKNRRSFGSNNEEHLKKFLLVVLFIIIRSLIKGKPYQEKFSQDLSSLENNAIGLLTITSILEIIGKLVGPQNRDKILLAYTLISAGSDIRELI